MLKKATCVLMVLLCVFSLSIFVSAADTEKTFGRIADSNLDDSIDIRDATNIQKFVAGIISFSELQNAVADVDRNATVNIKDATALQKNLAGYTTSFPVGRLIDAQGNVVEEQPEANPSVPEGEEAVTADVLRRIEEGFLRLVNEERARFGLCELTVNNHIDEVAQLRSAELLESYSHTRPDGTPFYTEIDYKKYQYVALGENIGITTHVNNRAYDPSKDRFVASDEQIEETCIALFEMFKKSPTHYANILRKDFEHTGIGISYIVNEEFAVPYFYVSQLFSADSK